MLCCAAKKSLNIANGNAAGVDVSLLTVIVMTTVSIGFICVVVVVFGALLTNYIAIGLEVMIVLIISANCASFMCINTTTNRLLCPLKHNNVD